MSSSSSSNSGEPSIGVLESCTRHVPPSSAFRLGRFFVTHQIFDDDDDLRAALDGYRLKFARKVSPLVRFSCETNFYNAID